MNNKQILILIFVYYMFDKYIIFLPDTYDQIPDCFCIKHYRFGIVQELLDKGITIKFKKDITTIIHQTKLVFDDELSPKLNILYIHLLGGEYYSDDKFSREKNERERKILFLLAAKLGVSSITYETELTDTTLNKISVSTNIKNVNTEATYSKQINKSNGQSGKEIYDNRGAPIFTLSINIHQVEENIKRKFGSLNNKMFSYDFYQNNANLRSFVYKRFSFKMSNMEYTSEIENNIELSFDVKTTLMNYGLGINFEKQHITTEKIIYNLDFYKNKELRIKLNEIVRLEEDTFGVIREIYDSEENKEISIYHITEYVRRYSKTCKITYQKLMTTDLDTTDLNSTKIDTNETDTFTETYYERLNHWIKTNSPEKFREQCKHFTSSYQIRTWFKDTLINDNEFVIEDENKDESNIENYGILKLKKDNFQIYIDNVLKDENISDTTKSQINSSSKRPGSLIFDADEEYALRDKPLRNSTETWTQQEIQVIDSDYGQSSGQTDQIINVDKFISPWQESRTIMNPVIDVVSPLTKIAELEQDYGQMACAPSDSDSEMIVETHIDKEGNKIRQVIQVEELNKHDKYYDCETRSENSIDNDNSFIQKDDVKK